MDSKEIHAPKPLRFVGPPHRLRLDGKPEGLSGERGLQFHADGDLGKFLIVARANPLKMKVRRRTHALSARLKLDPSTPPGTYHAHLSGEGSEIPIEILVGPNPRLRAVPAELVFEGVSGGEAQASMTLENRGNVPVEIPLTLTTGIYDDDGIESAFAGTYRQETDDVQALLGTFVRKLREGHGGLMKFRVEQGAGRLEPGDGRRILLRTQLPSKLKGGHMYHGVLTLETFNASIRVVVRKPVTSEER